MKVRFEKDKVIITQLAEFHPRQIFENGQAFRFRPVTEHIYEGVAFGRFLRVEKKKCGCVTLSPVTEHDFHHIWVDYFDLHRDYDTLFSESADRALRKGKEYAKGLRVLRQEPFETLISFIISANNNIGRIRQIIEKIAKRYGTPCTEGEHDYFAFPTPEQLARATEDELKECGSGYRARYIRDTAQMVAAGHSLSDPYEMEYEEAKEELMKFPGVGPKVADCVLLFAYQKMEAFPADVWIKRVMASEYGCTGTDREIYEFASKRFGKYAGIAQQYLFYYAREHAGKG